MKFLNIIIRDVTFATKRRNYYLKDKDEIISMISFL